MGEVITGDVCPCCGDIALPKCYSASWPSDQALYGLESEVRYYYECRKCGLRTKDYPSQKAALDAWNTRAERTCYLIIHDGSPACSECLTEQDYNAQFCDQCGAKVAKVVSECQGE